MTPHRTDWAAQPFFRTFGVVVDTTDPSYARLTVDRGKIQLRGVRASINGGIVASLAQAAAAVCLQASLDDNEVVWLLQELTVSYLSSARGEDIVIEARLLRKGGRIAVLDAEVRDAATNILNAKVLISYTIHRDETAAETEQPRP